MNYKPNYCADLRAALELAEELHRQLLDLVINPDYPDRTLTISRSDGIRRVLRTALYDEESSRLRANME